MRSAANRGSIRRDGPAPTRDFGNRAREGRRGVARVGANAPFTAHFICILTLAFPDGELQSFEGRVDGELVFPARGSLVFGYDPIFLPENLAKTFGEMTLEEKQAIPARRIASPVASCARFPSLCARTPWRLKAPSCLSALASNRHLSAKHEPGHLI